MIKVLITGANGMLGTAISKRLTSVELFTFTSKELDITCALKVQEKVASLRPDYIINCAAYTAVDLAEEQREKAFKINTTAVEKLAQIAAQYDATLIHFSTDYVFDGTSNIPYQPNDITNPINEYGASKLAGEKAIEMQASKYYIFRISWLYAPFGKNFFTWLTTTDQQQLNIVTSQVGSPTSALSVANFIHHVIKQDPLQYGLYHYVDHGKVSWYEFALKINELAELKKGIHSVDHYPTAARRPAYSVMDTSKTEEVFKYLLSPYQIELEKVIERL
ncbi:dTDP-4-dehydrorhamnose reductase [Nonlabens sp. SCSIO 43208]|uniref:dTDP-4-dehydrorhamnose reductase n=1 Tax=Nonlabens sp. SCSIO 43208 TaxID=2793009 RepID=UPI003D6A794A